MPRDLTRLKKSKSLDKSATESDWRCQMNFSIIVPVRINACRNA